jgi:Nucleotide modification associated domain 3
MSRIYLCNVGVNASHIGKGLQSPLFDDGTFEFVTIPELSGFQTPESARLVRYADLSCFNNPDQPLSDFIPPRLHQTVTHYDPEFEQFTYGDECGRTPRASALKKVQTGDWLVFIARLARYNRIEKKFSGSAGFYLVGAIEVAAILADVRGLPQADVVKRFGHNAHLRRAEVLPQWYDGFYIFKGSPNSQRFKVAKPFGRQEAERFLRDKNGQNWQWGSDRSDLQVIGSYTRTCRCVLDPHRTAEEAGRTQNFLEVFLNS